MSATSAMVTEEEKQAFEHDGVVCLRGRFERSWIDRLRDATERSLAEAGAHTREYRTNDGGRFHANQFLWLHDDDVKAFVFDSPAATIAADLMASETVSFFFDHLLVKEPGTENSTPWHQDLPYWPVVGEQICSMWFAMDVVDADNGGVGYVAGSHRWPATFRAQSFDGTNRYSDPSMPPAPDPTEDGDHRILTWRLDPGDVVVHHVRTLHGASGNKVSDRRRRGLSTRWCGDDAVFDPRPLTMPLPADPGIAPGSRMSGGLFPLVYERKSTT
jgi:ectoine hydroxylase-related dioxygenase (phytanoyl-CoA dioxygenase family)